METKPYIFEGKKEGYAETSEKYEKKLLEQASEFLKQKRVCESERDAYEELLDEYDAEIDALNAKLYKSEADK